LRSGDIIVIADGDQDGQSIAEQCGNVPKQTIKTTTLQGFENTLSQAYHPIVIVVCDTPEVAEEHVQNIRHVEMANEETAEFLPIIGVGQQVSEADLHAYEIGLDDYIVLSSQRSKTLSSTIRYWRGLEV